MPARLPIDDFLPAIVQRLQAAPNLVLQAAPGAGKTTRVPPAILAANLCAGRQLILIEPRRLAARTAAARMASELGCRVGDEVGYQVRFDRQATRATRLLVVTEGIFLRQLQHDPFLEHVGCVVFDEFHERHLDGDLALAMLRRVQQDARPDLKLVVMSATLETGPLAEYLQTEPIIVPAPMRFPVEIVYRPADRTRPLPDQTVAGIHSILAQTPGDVLVFLPGVGEIRTTARLLQETARREQLAVLPLYGDLTAREQDAVLAPNRQRKVILATNVAETSLTIDGVTGVVDSGYARVLQFEPNLGLNRLQRVRISQASAAQRTGRAGRTAPGMCVRLWGEHEQRGLPEAIEPEIRRVDLAGAVLELRCWGERDLQQFPWLEPPRPDALAQAIAVLTELGALTDSAVTDIGQRLVGIPLHPRLGRLLLAAEDYGHASRLALLAALLSERDPFPDQRSPAARNAGARQRSESDLLDRLQALEAFRDNGWEDSPLGRLNVPAAQFVLRAADQLERTLRAETNVHHDRDYDADQAVLLAVLAAFPDRIAKRREPGSPRGVLVGGRGVRLANTSAVLDAELFACVDLDAGQGEALVRLASGIERHWLPAAEQTSTIEVIFDTERKKVTAVKRTRWRQLLLEETTAPLPRGEEVADVLAQAAAAELELALPISKPPLLPWLNRVRWLRQCRPELELPEYSPTDWQALLPDLCSGCRSFADLQALPLVDILRSRLDPQQVSALERDAPERLRIPSGRSVVLEYEPGQPPVLAAKIQELFGWSETPRVGGGRIPVLLHLLAPNGRPQQITQDLPSFWANTYAQVRKDLRRRYPKHAWPEDPRTLTRE